MKLLALAGDASALIFEIRLRTPLTALVGQEGWALRCLSFHDCTHADMAWADVLVIQRGFTPRALRWQQRAWWRGVAVVYEIDDLLTALPTHISNAAAIAAQQPGLRRCVLNADALSVSTQRLGASLANTLRQPASLPAVFVVPNHALPLAEAALPQQHDTQPVSLVFASMERLAGGVLFDALKALPPQAVRIHAFGPPAQQFLEAGIDVEAHRLMPRAAFIDFVRSRPNPLAVIPLEDSLFASCKSALKWFEYAEAGVPVLCSQVSPYVEVVADGVTGRLVPNTAQAWAQALRAAVADAPWRATIANAARQQVRQHHTLAHTVSAWRTVLSAAVAQRQALGRVPMPWAAGVSETVSAASEGAALALRRWNRKRLAGRQRP